MLNKSGHIIVIDGVDGSGKTTQAQDLVDWINQSESGTIVVDSIPYPRAIKAREPGGTPVGESIRDILLSTKSSMTPETELMLFLASRAASVKRARDFAAKGGIVVFDRFTDSTVAYQGRARGIDISIIDQFNHFATGGLVPDITFILDASVEVSMERRKVRGSDTDRMEELLAQQFQVIRTSFLEDAVPRPGRRLVHTDDRSALDVFHDVLTETRRLLDV